MDHLNFGTDGWRDVIGGKFTFANVGRAAQAYGEYLLETGQETVVVGYDTRFNGELFARRVAEVLAAAGLRVLCSSTYLPTPALSFAVKHYGAGGGVMLTASHNPPAYNGFKLKGAYGGTATAEIYAQVSARANASENVPKPFDPQRHQLESFDIRKPYFAALAELVDVETLHNFSGSLAHDAMGGATAGWLRGFFKHAKLKIDLQEVHSVPCATFYGVNPEPIPANLGSTLAVMQETSIAFASATDGDGDRLGVVLPGGVFFNSHQIFAVLLDHLRRKGLSGRVVKTFTVSRLIERLAAARGLEVTETPVGFKHIVQEMLGGDVLIGGEESGGIGVAGYLPERDGLANTLLLLEATVTSGQPLSDLFADLEEEVGWHHAYDRLDLYLSAEAKDAVVEALANPPGTFANREVESVETLDGVKLNLSGSAWLLFRASGTEPLLRVYCEAQTAGEVEDILKAAKEFIGELA
jgi:phosphomannomutase